MQATDLPTVATIARPAAARECGAKQPLVG
jgi:hypothetical protein